MPVEQETSEHCLFVGGSADGRRIWIPTGRSEVMVPVASAVEVSGQLGDSCVSIWPKVEHEVYTRATLLEHDNRYDVFIGPDVGGDRGVLYHLIEHYRPKAAQRLLNDEAL